MMEILIIALIVYLGIRLAWWLIKVTLFLGIAAIVLAALFMPWVFVF